MKLREFCRLLGVQLEVLYLAINGEYYAHFANCNFKVNNESPFLEGITGRGSDAISAIEEFLTEIEGKRLIKDTVTGRSEYLVPKIEL